jgi:hypothetical protein
MDSIKAILMNPMTQRLIRHGLTAFGGWVGIDAPADGYNELAQHVIGAVLFLVGLWLSMRQDLPPSPPGSSSSRIGPNSFPVMLLCLMTFGGVVIQGGCAGQQARERVAVPALVSTVEAIIDEAYAGVESWPESERDTARIDVEAFQTSIASGDLITIQTDAYARWPLVKTLAMAGIDAKLEQNLIGAAGATARRNRLMAYQDALDSLVFGPLSGK